MLPNEILLIAESQWLFNETELLRTPSVLAGLSPAKERENRAKGVNFILQVGIMLKLPQITLATASVFLHRFFMRYSMVEEKPPNGGTPRPPMHYYSVAATSLFLATKVEENCRKMKELVIACVRVAQKNPAKLVDEQDKEYWRWKDTILQMEDVLLEAICFDLSIDPPYKTLFNFLVYFGEENNKRLRNAAWAFVNDSCLTMLCLLFSSRTIAASSLYAAAKHCGVKFPDDPDGRPWWEAVGVELRQIRKACNFMAGVYENSPLRGGSDAGMYERTPEDGDDWLAKTRERIEGSEGGRDPQDMRRAPSATSNAGSDASKKRRREEEEGGEANGAGPGYGVNRTNGNAEGEAQEEIPWGGDVPEEREGSKRPKLDTNGTDPNPTSASQIQLHINGNTAATSAPLNEERGLESPKLPAMGNDPKRTAAPNQSGGPVVQESGLVSPNLDDVDVDVSEEGEIDP